MKKGFRIALIVWTIIMLTLSSMPDLKAPEMFPKFSDKIVHFIEYFIWALLLILMLKQEDRIKKIWGALFAVFIIGLVLGIADEFHQMFVAGRDADVRDLAADVGGIILALIIFRIFYRKPKYYLPRRS